VRRRLLPLLALLFVLAPAGAAAAAPGPGADDLVYTGTFTSVHANGVTDPVRDSTFTLRCAEGSCEVIDGFSYFPEPIVFTDGVAAYDFIAEGDGCDSRQSRDTHIAMTATPQAITGTLIYDDKYPSGCANGTTRVYGTTSEFSLAYVSGETCLLDDSCATAPEVVVVTPDAGPREFASPTVFSELPTAAEAASGANPLWAAAGTIVLALLIAIPTHFLNTAIETFGDRLRSWWQRVRGRTASEPATTPAARRGFAGWPVALAGLLGAAVITAFADPGFGFDAAGLRVLLSIVATFAIEVVLGWVAVLLIVRRTHPGVAASIRFAPLSLLIVVAAVVVTRVTGFEPPIVFGLVAGVVFGGLLATADKARVALIGLGWSFGIGVIAWLGYSILTAAGPPEGGTLVASEVLSAAAIAGISALPIALLPLRGLAGRTVWDWSRGVWIGCYAVASFAFLLVLLPLPASWAEVGVGLWTWVGLYLAYALGAVAIWVVVTRPWRARA
jgi:hypothetical protein